MPPPHLSGHGLPVVPSLAVFNSSEYYTPDRRFILGAVTYYAGPRVWALEISPYDTASAAMITTLYEAVRKGAFFGPGLAFHPTSENVMVEAKKLPGSVPLVTTDEIYAGTDYQPLTIASAIGRLSFATAASLSSIYLSHEEIVVLDEAPNDISVVQGLITEEFQTPLSHVNVLSANRHTPNMGLKGAMSHPVLREHEGLLVELSVEASDWSLREVSQEEAEAFWAAHKPQSVVLPAPDVSLTSIIDVEGVAPEGVGITLREAIKSAVPAYGGKTAQYAVLARTQNIPTRKAFAVPVFYYDQFMKQNGFYDRVEAWLADPAFTADYRVRDERLQALRGDMMKAPLDAGFQALLRAKIDEGYQGAEVRFRTSTNSEDLEAFPCAGCYESHTGDPANWDSVLDAIRATYASTWLFRTFEERSYYSVDHNSVAMGLLVHQNFPEEEANGVAVTLNPFDTSGLDPAFYVNVQHGGYAEVVHPPTGVTTDQFLYYYYEPNQPVVYLSRSNLILEGESVLSVEQVHTLGAALDLIHKRFSAAYGPAAGNTGWYAMDVEFKFDDEDAPGQPPALYIKQARPYPGRG